MEGRRPPPLAEHPFPNEVDLAKFWNTPKVKAYFKGLTVFFGVFGTLVGLNFYIQRDQTHVLGRRVLLTKEEIEKKTELRRARAEIGFGLGLPFRYNFLTPVIGGPDLRFDEGIKLQVHNPNTPKVLDLKEPVDQK